MITSTWSMKKIDFILGEIVKLCNPASIFLYGSRARTDFLKRSDFEIGVLLPKSRYVSRGEIKKNIDIPTVNIYPFILENFKNGAIDTPFQKSVYLRELTTAGKTLYGEEVIEHMKPPSLTIVDLMQDLRFNIGYALASIISHRNKDSKTASLEFYKSCLFATRSLVALKKKKFALTYDEIFSFSKEVNLGMYSDLVALAYKCRLGKSKYTENSIYENISYLNKFIEPELVSYFEKFGDKVIIK